MTQEASESTKAPQSPIIMFLSAHGGSATLALGGGWGWGLYKNRARRFLLRYTGHRTDGRCCPHARHQCKHGKAGLLCVQAAQVAGSSVLSPGSGFPSWLASLPRRAGRPPRAFLLCSSLHHEPVAQRKLANLPAVHQLALLLGRDGVGHFLPQ